MFASCHCKLPKATFELVLVLHLTRQNPTDEVILEAKQHLLRCATPDCVLQTSFSETFANDDRNFLWNEYLIEQRHLALDQLMTYHFGLLSPFQSSPSDHHQLESYRRPFSASFSPSFSLLCEFGHEEDYMNLSESSFRFKQTGAVSKSSVSHSRTRTWLNSTSGTTIKMIKQNSMRLFSTILLPKPISVFFVCI